MNEELLWIFCVSYCYSNSTIFMRICVYIVCIKCNNNLFKENWIFIHRHTQTCDSSGHTHCLTALFLGLPRWAGTRKVKPIWMLLKQKTVSGNGISWAICKSAPCSRQITTPAPHHSVFYRPDALPAAQPTASKHWRHSSWHKMDKIALLRLWLIRLACCFVAQKNIKDIFL